MAPMLVRVMPLRMSPRAMKILPFFPRGSARCMHFGATLAPPLVSVDANPRSGGGPQINWAASVNRPHVNPGAVNRSNYSAGESHSAERPGDHLESEYPPRQRPSNNSQTARDAANGECRQRFQLPPYGPQSPTQLTTTLDIEQALRSPLEGWVHYDVMFRMGNPFLRTESPIVSAPLDQFPPRRLSVGVVNGPATVALVACSAIKPTARDFRMLDGARELESPLADTSHEVWPLP